VYEKGEDEFSEWYRPSLPGLNSPVSVDGTNSISYTMIGKWQAPAWTRPRVFRSIFYTLTRLQSKSVVVEICNVAEHG